MCKHICRHIVFPCRYVSQHRDPDLYRNRAYNEVVIENQEAEKQQRGGGGEGKYSEDEYVVTENPPPPTSSTTITAGSGESLHEPL